MRTVLLLLLCCISSIAVADSLKEIELNRKETQMRPLSIMSEPAAYQTDAVINIRLPDASPYVTVSIVNEETGAQVYSMIYAGTNKIQINIENEPESISWMCEIVWMKLCWIISLTAPAICMRNRGTY